MDETTESGGGAGGGSRWLELAVLFAAGAVPIGFVLLSFGYAQLGQGLAKGPPMFAAAHSFGAPYIVWLYIPAAVGVFLFLLMGRTRWPSLWRRLAVGLGAGAVATLALDAARQAGVIHGWLPGDTPVMFGKVALGGAASMGAIYGWGLLIHYANGANFGVLFAFLAGRRRSVAQALGWGVGWALLVEVGMMTAPPMAPIVGAFGTRFMWPQFFLATLVAHILFGLALGYLAQLWLTRAENGSFLRPGPRGENG